MNDPFWEPLWACCQELGVPMHWHGSSGLVQQVVPAKVGRIQPRGISHCLNLAALRHTGATDPQSDLLRHSRPLSAFQLGVRRNRLRLGELRARSPRSRVAAARVYGMKGVTHQTERSFSAADLCRFLVREGGYRAARAGRRRQYHVGIRLSAHRVDLSEILEFRRSVARGCAGGRTKENALWQRAQAVRPGIVSEPSEDHLKRSERAFKGRFSTSPRNRGRCVTI